MNTAVKRERTVLYAYLLHGSWCWWWYMLMSRESSCDSIKASVSWILTNVTDETEMGILHMNLDFSNNDWNFGDENVHWTYCINSDIQINTTKFGEILQIYWTV
jgi:hypothetical protein